MIASKLTCPHCRAVVTSNRPVPAGARLRCPRCSASFTAPAAPAVEAEVVPDPDSPRRGWLLPVAVLAGVLLLAGGGAAAFLALRGHPPEEADLPPPPVTVKPAPQPLIVLTPAEELKVKEVTGRGVEFLKRAQNPQGFWDGSPPGAHRVGVTALTGLTLLECGVPKDDPAVQRAAAFLRDQSPRNNMTYDLALGILFFDRLGEARDNELIQNLTLTLVTGQGPQGALSYGCRPLAPHERGLLLDALRRLARVGPAEFAAGEGQALFKRAPGLRTLGVFQNVSTADPNFFRRGGDNSNTQFALLALWAARRHGLPVEPSLALVARHFELGQFPDGSWPYSGGQRNVSPTGAPTMTCAGLLGLAVGYGLAKDTGGKWGTRRSGRPADDPAVKKAVEVISRRVGEPRKEAKGPPPPMPEMYFLWSVERVAVLWRLKTVGGRPWYHWGLDMLAAHQQPDGHWKAPTGHGSCPVLDTAFALLFLQRANLAADLTDKLEELQNMPVWNAQIAGKE